MVCWPLAVALQKLESDPGHIEIYIYFQYSGSVYEQQDGTAIGSLVSTVISNLHMEMFEEQAITSTPCKPKIWKCYMDNTFTILDQISIDYFLQHLNSQQPTICFTMETESDNKIVFPHENQMAS